MDPPRGPFYAMKHLLLIPFLALVSLPVNARYAQPGFSNQCFEEVYREEYIPGTLNNPGRVRTYIETVEVECPRTQTNPHYLPADPPRQRSNVDDNSCVEGSILGGITGGALGGVLSTQQNWIWSIPAGVVGGALVGCQIDGG